MRWDGELRLCHELGKQLHEIMGWPGPMTHRQFRVWKQWLSDEWNRPSRSDHYMMRAALETRLGNAGKKARQVRMEHFTLKFERKRANEDERTAITQEDEIARKTETSKAGWLSMMTVPVKKVEA